MKYVIILLVLVVSKVYSEEEISVRLRNLLNGYNYGLVSIEPEELEILQEEEQDLLQIADLVVKIEERN